MRRLVLALAIVSRAGAAAAAARAAGTYDVYACGGPAGGGAERVRRRRPIRAWTPTRSARRPAPSAPASSPRRRRAAAWRRYCAGAYQVFEAPPGASLQSVSFNVGAIRLRDYWSVGHRRLRRRLQLRRAAVRLLRRPAGMRRRHSVLLDPVTVAALRPRAVPLRDALLSTRRAATSRRAASRPATGRCSRPRTWSCGSRTRRRRRSRPHHGALWSDGWHRGYEEAWQCYTDNVGIMITRMYVDGEPRDSPGLPRRALAGWVRCDFTRPPPCIDVEPGGLGLDTRTLADGRALGCASRRSTRPATSAASITTILVDNNAPAKPRDARASTAARAGARVNDFTVRWSNPPRTGGADRAGALPALPRRRAARAGSRAGDGTSAAAASSVPAPGEYALRVWLEDAAGNHDAEPRERPGPPALRRRGADAPSSSARPATIRSRSPRPSPTAVLASPRGRSRPAATGEPVWQGPRSDVGAASAWSPRSTTRRCPTGATSCARTCATAPATSARPTGGATAPMALSLPAPCRRAASCSGSAGVASGAAARGRAA